jgi:hypothetical protein
MDVVVATEPGGMPEPHEMPEPHGMPEPREVERPCRAASQLPTLSEPPGDLVSCSRGRGRIRRSVTCGPREGQPDVTQA